MKFSRLISTIFLISTFLCILLFAGIFWLYSSADSKTLGLLKDSLSTASGFFGGITTLIAAYIASRLFNDWKEQHNKQVLAFEAKQLHLDLSQFMRSIADFEVTKYRISPYYFDSTPIRYQLQNLDNAHQKLTIPLLDFMDLSKQNKIKELIAYKTDSLAQQELILNQFRKGKEEELTISIEETCYILRCNTNALKEILQSYIFVK